MPGRNDTKPQAPSSCRNKNKTRTLKAGNRTRLFGWPIVQGIGASIADGMDPPASRRTRIGKRALRSLGRSHVSFSPGVGRKAQGTPLLCWVCRVPQQPFGRVQLGGVVGLGLFCIWGARQPVTPLLVILKGSPREKWTTQSLKSSKEGVRLASLQSQPKPANEQTSGFPFGLTEGGFTLTLLGRGIPLKRHTHTHHNRPKSYNTPPAGTQQEEDIPHLLWVLRKRRSPHPPDSIEIDRSWGPHQSGARGRRSRCLQFVCHPQKHTIHHIQTMESCVCVCDFSPPWFCTG